MPSSCLGLKKRANKNIKDTVYATLAWSVALWLTTLHAPQNTYLRDIRFTTGDYILSKLCCHRISVFFPWILSRKAVAGCLGSHQRVQDSNFTLSSAMRIIGELLINDSCSPLD